MKMIKDQEDLVKMMRKKMTKMKIFQVKDFFLLFTVCSLQDYLFYPFLLFTEELKLDYVDEKTGEIPLSRFGVLGCLSSFRETTGMAIQIKDRIILQHSNIHQFIHRMSMCLKSSCPVDQYISLFSCPH